MTLSLASFLFSISNLGSFWIIGYKNYLNIRHTLFLTACILLQLLMNFLGAFELSIALVFPIIATAFLFTGSFSKNWILATLYFFFHNMIIMLSWLITLEPLYTLLLTNVISLTQYRQFYPVAIIFQQVLLFSTLFTMRKRLMNRVPFQSIYFLPKRYIVQSFICFPLILLLSSMQKYSCLISNRTLFFSSTSSLLILSGIFCYNIYMSSRLCQKQQEITLLTKKAKNDKKNISLANEFKHDYRNILLSLNTYLHQDQLEQARDYLSSITGYSNTLIEANQHSQIFSVNVLPVQGILSKFLERCENNNISTKLIFSENISYSDITINSVDFIRCLSILLDNAVEAALEVSDPLIYVTIKRSKSALFIEVKNNYEGTVSVEKALQNNFTQKKGHQGKGLTIFANLLKNYSDTSYYFAQKNNFFTAQFSLPKKVMNCNH